jgi:hypothetical protein
MNQFPQYQWTIWGYRTEKPKINSLVTTVVVTEVMPFPTQEMGTTWLARIVCSYLFYFKSTAPREIYKIQIYSTSLRSHSLNKVFLTNKLTLHLKTKYSWLYVPTTCVDLSTKYKNWNLYKKDNISIFLTNWQQLQWANKQWIHCHQTKFCMLCHDENMITHKKRKPKIILSISIPLHHMEYISGEIWYTQQSIVHPKQKSSE